jgi:hypothetical protein
MRRYDPIICEFTLSLASPDFCTGVYVPAVMVMANGVAVIQAFPLRGSDRGLGDRQSIALLFVHIGRLPTPQI